MNIQLSPRMRQGATMTGQMQQAISLLQYTNTELQSHIEREAEENPFIEFAPMSRAAPNGSATGLGEAQDAIARLAERPVSLVGHVLAQLDLMFPDAHQRVIAERFLEALDQNGWLDEPLEEIAFSAGIDMGEAEQTLEDIQRVEPTGLFARNLAECLRLQVEARDLMSPVVAALLDNLPLLAAADMQKLLRACSCSMAELRAALSVIRTLDPKPASAFEIDIASEREPDLIVRRVQGEWLVELNRSTLPAVHVDEKHARAMTRDVTARAYTSERLRMAKWLHRAVEHRNQTTLAVAAEIVRRQSAFLERGAAYLAPLTLADVADAVGVHESTVSRVTTGILMVTPQGALPVKRFFSTALAGGVSANGGEATSAASVRHRIEQLVAAEDASNPLSDDAIARAINDGGPVLARRTVAKYRGQLRIPSSFERKRRAQIAQS